MKFEFFVYRHEVKDPGTRKDGVMNHYDLAFQQPDGTYIMFSTIKCPMQLRGDKIFACYREDRTTKKDIEFLSTYNDSKSTLYDKGTYHRVNDWDARLKDRRPLLLLRILGNKLAGVYKLEKINEFWKTGKPQWRHEATGHSWLLIKQNEDLYKEENDFDKETIDA